MHDALTDLRRAIEVERVQQTRRATACEERVATLQRQVEALKSALAQRAETAEHPVPALTLDVSSLTGVAAGRPDERALLAAVCGVRLVDANRAALRLLRMGSRDELMERAGEVFRTDLIAPLVRFSRLLARGAGEFRCSARLRDGAGGLIGVELRTLVERAPVRRITFAVIDAPSSAVSPAVRPSTAEAAQNSPHDLAREAA